MTTYHAQNLSGQILDAVLSAGALTGQSLVDIEGEGVAVTIRTGDAGGRLQIRTKTGGVVVFDSENLPSSGSIIYGSQDIGSYDLAGDTTIDTTAILHDLGLCCFDVEFTPAGATESSVGSFEGAKVYDLRSIFGESAGRPERQLSSNNLGNMTWLSVGNSHTNGGVLGSGFNYVHGVRRDISTDPALLTVSFAVPVRNLVFETSDIEILDIPNTGFADVVTIEADLDGAPTAVSASLAAGTANIVGSPGQSVVITGTQAPGPAIDQIVAVTVPGELDELRIEYISDVDSLSSANAGIGVNLISAECADPALA